MAGTLFLILFQTLSVLGQTAPDQMFSGETLLRMNMRKAWTDHVVWTRNVIFCLVDDLPGKEQAVNRLLLNQDDIGNLFKPYYGEEEGSNLTKILYEHINLSAKVIAAGRTGNMMAYLTANKRWHANANQMAIFFNKHDPAWPLADLKAMMALHLDLTIDEAQNRMKKDYTADVIGFDKIQTEILKMADMFTNGIIKQNPSRFMPIGDIRASGAKQ